MTTDVRVLLYLLPTTDGIASTLNERMLIANIRIVYSHLCFPLSKPIAALCHSMDVLDLDACPGRTHIYTIAFIVYQNVME
jgi:hypothetical protein